MVAVDESRGHQLVREAGGRVIRERGGDGRGNIYN